MSQYTNRFDAGLILSRILESKEIKHDIVICLPRGGIPVALAIADQLNIPFKIAYVKKIGHPINPEFGIGAVSATSIQFDIDTNVSLDSSKELIEKARQRIQEMKLKFNHEWEIKKIESKNVLLVDDGIATGQCMKLAIHEIRKGNPKTITVAVPVCPVNKKDLFSKLADEFICPVIPMSFTGIGLFYEDFHQLSDHEVSKMIKK